MVTRSRSFLPVLAGLMLLCGACADRDHGKKIAEPSLVTVIKSAKLTNYQSATIGTAFDSYSYLTGKEWRMAQLTNGHFTVDYVGWFRQGVLSRLGLKKEAVRGLEVTFVVEPNGSFYLFMISELTAGADGKMMRTQFRDTGMILDRIYANRRIEPDSGTDAQERPQVPRS